jgi:ribosomal protein S18 acetylase RimI-like enzyme
VARPEIVAFADEHLPEAAALLAERHRRHRSAEPLLSGRYEDPAAAAEELHRAWGAPGASGAAAIRDGRLAGYLVGAPRPGAVWGPNACYLGFASTLPEFRGQGLGLALTDAVLARAREQGYPSMVTDWRVTNLLASRFWPRRGFRTSFLRLYRSIP